METAASQIDACEEIGTVVLATGSKSIAGLSETTPVVRIQVLANEWKLPGDGFASATRIVGSGTKVTVKKVLDVIRQKSKYRCIDIVANTMYETPLPERSGVHDALCVAVYFSKGRRIKRTKNGIIGAGAYGEWSLVNSWRYHVQERKKPKNQRNFGTRVERIIEEKKRDLLAQHPELSAQTKMFMVELPLLLLREEKNNEDGKLVLEDG